MDDATLTPLVAGFTSETAHVGGVRLHYWQGGDPNGPPVLLWHGFLSTGYTWRKVMPLLAAAGYAVLVPDMRGYGDSDKPAGVAGYDGRALGEEFRALVRQIGFGMGRPLLVAAHDMGAPPALLWAADHPDEIAGLLYIEEPTMLLEALAKIIAYNPTAMKDGSLWWWLLPLAPDVPERLIVGSERAFLTWFYDRDTARRDAIEPSDVEEFLRTFAGREGVLGAMGVYRTQFTTIAQTEPLRKNKVKTPIAAIGGDKSLGPMVRAMLALVAENVSGSVLADCGHFVPEEQPDAIVKEIQALSATLALCSDPQDSRAPRGKNRPSALQAGAVAAAIFAGVKLWSSLRSASVGQNNPKRQTPHDPNQTTPTQSTSVQGADTMPDAATDTTTSTTPNNANALADAYPPLPPDNPRRSLTLAESNNDLSLPHIGVVGDTYTILVTGADTAGQFTVIDMLVPPGGGPGPHRHDFEETFVMLEGEVEATFRGKKITVRAGDTLNIPANAPHMFHNLSARPARLLCTCSPSGQELFFMEFGVPVATRTTEPPKLDAEAQAKTQAKMAALAPKFRTEVLDHA